MDGKRSKKRLRGRFVLASSATLVAAWLLFALFVLVVFAFIMGPAVATVVRTWGRVPVTPRKVSPFAYRGIVEGFYSAPYSHADRLDLLTWENGQGMNVYIHAPKKDPFV